MKSGLIILYLLFFICLDSFAQIANRAYVVNTLGESLSIIDLDNQTVLQPPKALGLFANDVKIAGEKACVVISGLNEIRIFDIHTQNELGNVYLGAGTNPYEIDFINDSLAVISLLLTNRVAFVNLKTQQIEKLVNVGTGPQGVLYSQEKVYVANSGFNGAGYDPGKVSVIELDHYSVSDIDVGVNPQSLDIDIYGNVIVACSGDYVSIGAQMDIIDTALGTVIFNQPVNQPITSIAVNKQNLAFLATYSSGVMVYDLSEKSFILDDSKALRGGPGVAFDQANNTYICHFDLDSVYVYSPDHQKIHSYLVGDGPISIDVCVQSESNGQIREHFQLFQNYPNPFNFLTRIQFQLPAHSFIEIDIFNIRGQMIKNVYRGEFSEGTHSLFWDGRDDRGNNVASGSYFYRMKSPDFEQVRSMILIK